MGKRKSPSSHSSPTTSSSKKGKSSDSPAAASIPAEDIKAAFRPNLFDEAVLKEYNEQYLTSGPYRHVIIPTLISPPLLHAVKSEILSHLSFTPKETDIYRLHQTGDLANLSGLPAELAAKLPSLRRLRDALYSQTFRDYVCAVTGCGALSGTKTDMAINVYTPGCHLLTHDDVIGSRRVSYILYLCGSEEEPWKEEWGGVLRLYPTETAEDGTKVPKAEWSRVCPPAWNQLAFFEVVPGESFHDVEEVYDGADGDRTRMAISGWFHIPQRGEEGFVEGVEEELGKKSSLASLQSKSEKYDRPQPQVVPYSTGKGKGKAVDSKEDDDGFTPQEIEFLLKYIHPTFLTPDTLEELSEQFAKDSSIQISSFLRIAFKTALREYITTNDTQPSTWPVAVPPHKQKYLYLQPTDSQEEMSPIEELLNILLPSREFRKLLQHATGLKLTSHNILARRFRKGMDYTLATGLNSSSPAAGEDAKMQLEIALSLTPSSGWEPCSPPSPPKKAKKKSRLNPDHVPEQKKQRFDDSTRTLGGYEMYMSAEDDDPTNDPAVYKAGGEDGDDDDGVLFMNYPSWNTLNVALRDEGVLKFVKYVSAEAKGDRWDLVGEFGVEEVEEGSGDEEGEGSGGEEEEESDEGKWDQEEEWKGCSP
ncbi:Oxoglutarate and iron-dependent oxygenase degradation C-term-domain-containing protein [Trichophaea hybrida]|nr:Oxoglutarate and iron-dependent oxygenase degradation C-term-domain-containing protein [Trichophaea hybrida]